MSAIELDRVAAVREFNRSYSKVMGFLQQGLLRSRFSLVEGRIVFELSRREITDVSVLRAALGVDAGQLSRTLTKLEAAGVVQRSRSDSDGRRHRVSLTPAGREAFTDLNARADQQAEELLAAFSDDDQRRLVASMDTVRRLLSEPVTPVAFVIRGLRPGDLGWIVQRNGALYAQEYGWDRTYEALVARIVADYVDQHDPGRENAWIAELDGRRVGAILCVREDDQTARLRLLHVEPAARGSGLGSRLVDECLRFARSAGYSAIELWTNDVLVAARRIYQKAGFRLIKEEPHHSFGHALVGQTWRLDL